MGQILAFWLAQGLYQLSVILLGVAGLNFLILKVTRIYFGYILCGLIGLWFSLPSQVTHSTQKSISGIIYDEPKRSKPGLVHISIASADGKFKCKGKDLPWLNVSKLKKGDSVVMLVTLSPLKKSLNPFSFDSQKWIQGDSGHCKIISSTTSISSRKSIITNHKQIFLSSLFSSVQRRTTGGVMAAMSVGDTSKITSPIDRSFRDSGLYHLLVVSGYQVMFLFFLIKQSIFVLCSKKHQESGLAKIIGLAAGLSISIYFGLITGLESATERALLAVVVSQVVKLVGLKNNDNRDLICTALLLSIIYPGIFLTPSFELTFAALYGLSVASKSSKKAIYQGIISTISATSAASLMSLVWFGKITILSLPMNLIFAPLFSLISTAGTLLGVLVLLLTGSNLMLLSAENGTEVLLYLVSEASMISSLITAPINTFYAMASVILILFLSFRSRFSFMRNYIASRAMRRRIHQG